MLCMESVYNKGPFIYKSRVARRNLWGVTRKILVSKGGGSEMKMLKANGETERVINISEQLLWVYSGFILNKLNISVP